MSTQTTRLGRLRHGAAAATVVLVGLVGPLAASPAYAGDSSGGQPQIDVVKSAQVDGSAVEGPLLPGDSFDYVLEVTNTGDARARSVVVTDDLPAAVTPDGPVTVADGGTVLDSVPGDDPVVVDLGTLDPGDARTITIPVRLVADATGCSVFRNQATVTYKHGYGDEYSGESNEVELAVGCADLVINKVVASDGPFAVGDEVTFDIEVSLATVSHPVPVAPVVVTDVVDPDRFAFVSASDGGTFADGTVTWTLEDGLTPGDPPVRLSITLRLLPQEASDYPNTACVTLGPGDKTPVVRPDDDCDTATVTPTDSTSISIVKTNDPEGIVKFGDTITYTLTVSVPDSATSPQTSVEVRDIVPGYDPDQPDSGVTTYVEDSAECIGEPPAVGTCDISEITTDGVVTELGWSLGTIEPGESRQVTFAVTADEQEAVVEGSETVDFINVAAVRSDQTPWTPSNEVVNTAVITEVSDNTPPDNLPPTGTDTPVGPLSLLGLLLVALGMLATRHPVVQHVLPGRHAKVPGRHRAG